MNLNKKDISWILSLILAIIALYSYIDKRITELEKDFIEIKINQQFWIKEISNNSWEQKK